MFVKSNTPIFLIFLLFIQLGKLRNVPKTYLRKSFSLQFSNQSNFDNFPFHI